jgi:hypothetical protein
MKLKICNYEYIAKIFKKDEETNVVILNSAVKDLDDENVRWPLVIRICVNCKSLRMVGNVRAVPNVS